MSDQGKGWPPRNAAKVSEVLDWMRRGMNAHGKGLLLLAVGQHSICFSKDPKLSPEMACQILVRNIDALQEALSLLKEQEQTRSMMRRQDADGTEEIF